MASCRVYVQEGIYDAFVGALAGASQTLKVGDPFEEDTFNGPLVSKVHLDKVLGYVQKGIDEGATLVVGGKRIGDKGFFCETTIFSDVTDDMTIARQEIFGPVLSILKFKDVDEVISRVNNTKHGLAGGVVGTNINNVNKISRSIKAGIIYVNHWRAP